jgi:hypothetical protein
VENTKGIERCARASATGVDRLAGDIHVEDGQIDLFACHSVESRRQPGCRADHLATEVEKHVFQEQGDRSFILNDENTQAVEIAVAGNAVGHGVTFFHAGALADGSAEHGTRCAGCTELQAWRIRRFYHFCASMQKPGGAGLIYDIII